MKRLFLFLLICATTAVTAQIQTPQPSPAAKVMQKVGLTDITVEYSRPAMRGRTIFGDLVPFDKIWRTGANANTTITVGDDFTFGGTDVKAGTYAVFTKPGKKQWDVYLYSKTDNWGAPRSWDESLVVATATVPVQEMNLTQESFTIGINELSMDSAHLQISWENSLVAIPITVPTKKKTEESIMKVMSGEAQPSVNDYYSAAAFYYEAGTNLEQALEWITKATEMNDKAFWMFTRKSLIEEKLGKKKDAVKTAKTALALAKDQKNADYVKINEDNLKRWGAM